MEPEFVQWLTGQLGIGGLAGFALWMLNQSYQDSLRRERESSEEQRQLTQLVIAALTDNAQALKGLEAAIRNARGEYGKPT